MGRRGLGDRAAVYPVLFGERIFCQIGVSGT